MAADLHPDANRLSAFLEGSLPDPARQQLLAHLGACAACRHWAAYTQAASSPAGSSNAAFVPASQHRSPAPARIWRAAPGWGGQARWGPRQSLRLLPAALAAGLVLAAAGVWMLRPAPSPALPPPAATRALAAAAPISPPSPHRRAVVASPGPAAAPSAAANWFVLPALPVANDDTSDGASATAVVASLPESAPAVPSGEFQPSIDFSPLMTGFQDQPQLRPAPASLVDWSTPASAPAAAPPTATASDAPAISAPTPSAANAFMSAGFAESEPGPLPLSGPFAPTTAAALGWAVSRGGQVLHSLGTGVWAAIPLMPGLHFRSVFASGSTIWAGAGANQVFVSHDRGAHWRHVSLPHAAAPATVASIVFTNPNDGEVTLSDGQVWLTANGGATWSAPAP